MRQPFPAQADGASVEWAAPAGFNDVFSPSLLAHAFGRNTRRRPGALWRATGAQRWS